MLKALIFDVDGTLAETEERHRLAFNQAFMLEGLDWFWDEALYAELLKVTGGKERIRSFMEALAPERLADATLIPRLHALKTKLYAQAVLDGGIALRPGMEALLEAARAEGLSLAIATTTSPENVDALLTPTLGPRWRELFRVVAAGDMVPAKKPAPDVYRLALEGLNLPACETLALEDSRNGVVSARAAGAPVVALRSRYARADDLNEALAIFPDSATASLAALRAIHAAGAARR